MNKAILVGRLTRDPEVRYTQQGTCVCTFTLAVDRPWTRGKENTGTQQTADFIPIVVWSKLAEICGNNITKGRKVGVGGRIQVRSYEATDGSKRYITEVVAEEVEFLDPKNGGTSGSTDNESGAGAAQHGQTVPDEEIPF